MTTRDGLAAEGAPIRDLFLADHRWLDDILERLVSAVEANDQPEVTKLWAQFEPRLLKHLEAEEAHLVPTLHAVSPRDASGILEEHRLIRRRISELGLGVELHTVRLETARAFADELRAHAQIEDGALYRWCDEHLKKEERPEV